MSLNLRSDKIQRQIIGVIKNYQQLSVNFNKFPLDKFNKLFYPVNN